MFSNIIASSEELSVLTRVLDDHCVTHDVVDVEQRSAVARILIELFSTGVTSEASLRALLPAKLKIESSSSAA